MRVLTRGKVLFPEPEPGSATCSSTMKEAKFLDTLELALGATDAEGPVALRVCPYTYCSLNGHKHSPAVPLRSFLASRRRLIKTQQSMKLKGVSAFRKKSGEKSSGGGGAKIAPLIDEEAVGDFFVEVYAGRGHRREEGRGRRHRHRVSRAAADNVGRGGGGGAATASAARPHTPAGGGEGADTARLLRPIAGSRWSRRVGEGAVPAAAAAEGWGGDGILRPRCWRLDFLRA